MKNIKNEEYNKAALYHIGLKAALIAIIIDF